jgi:hypothetical protein
LVDNYVAGESQPSCHDESQQIRFSFLELVADPQNLVANTAEMITALKDLGAAMEEEVHAQDDHSEILAAYTYLGQTLD